MLSGNKAFFDADWSPLNNSIVTASADRHVRIYDPRSTGKYSDYLNYFYLEYILVNTKKKYLSISEYNLYNRKYCENNIHISHGLGAVCALVYHQGHALPLRRVRWTGQTLGDQEVSIYTKKLFLYYKLDKSISPK